MKNERKAILLKKLSYKDKRIRRKERKERHAKRQMKKLNYIFHFQKSEVETLK